MRRISLFLIIFVLIFAGNSLLLFEIRRLKYYEGWLLFYRV